MSNRQASTTMTGNANPLPKPQAWLPEMHRAFTSGGTFAVETHDFVTRHFLCLTLPPEATVLMVYDPAFPEQAQLFVEPSPPLVGRTRFIGFAYVYDTMTEKGQRDRIYLSPSELTKEGWVVASYVKPNTCAYFRDSAGQLALGYRDGVGYHILTGPRGFEPLFAHPALPTFEQATAQKGGAQ